MLGESTASSTRSVPVDELRANNLETNAWVAVRGKVYDLTTFLDRYVLLLLSLHTNHVSSREKSCYRPIGQVSLPPILELTSSSSLPLL